MGDKPNQCWVPLDIVCEILKRLPANTLRRFTTATSQWGTAIKSTSFAKDHQYMSQQNPLILMTDNKYDAANKINTLQITTYNKDGDILEKFSSSVPKMINSAQSFQGFSLFPKTIVQPILLYNPSFKKIITLPRTEGLDRCIGFGHVEITKELKMVRFFEDLDKNVRCQVLTLGTPAWREVKCPPYHISWGAPFLNGCLHLLPDSYSNLLNNEDAKSISVFDLECEDYTRWIPIPECYFMVEKRDFVLPAFHRLIERRGELGLVRLYDSLMSFWLLKDGGVWVKEYNLDLTLMNTKDFFHSFEDRLDIETYINLLLNFGVKELKEFVASDHPMWKKCTFSSSAIFYVDSLSPEKCYLLL